MKEKDILYEAGNYWVMKYKDVYYAMKCKFTHSESIVGFKTFSLAKAYVDYLSQKTI